MVLVLRTVNGFTSGLWARRNRMSSPGWSTVRQNRHRLGAIDGTWSGIRPRTTSPVVVFISKGGTDSDSANFPAVAASARLRAREPTQQRRKGCLSGHLRMIRVWWAYPSQPGVCWDSRRAAPYDVHDQSDPDVLEEIAMIVTVSVLKRCDKVFGSLCNVLIKCLVA
ncbi:hypothetical protein Lal_00019356 [Lupinus albus]|nr:hypothetical protein Lal_00019356 [Lupinus albus]